MGPGQPPLSAFSKRCSRGELEALVTAPCLRQALPPAAGTPLSKRDITQPPATSSVLLFPVVHSKHLTENIWQSPHTERRRQERRRQSIPNRQTKPSYEGICSTQRGTWGRGPLPSVTSIFCLLTAWHCPAMGPAELGPLADPWPRLGPRAVPNAWGCSCSCPPGCPTPGWGGGTGLAARACPDGCPWGAPGPELPQNFQENTLELPLTLPIANRLTDTQMVPVPSWIKSSARYLYTLH